MMKIGIAAPVDIHSLGEYFPDIKTNNLPKGIGGTIIPTYLTKEFIARGHSVSLYTSDKEIEQPSTFTGNNLKIFVGRYRKRARNRALDFFAVERQDIYEAIISDTVDIVNAHWTYEFALSAQATKTPTIITARDAPFAILRYNTNVYRFIRLLMASKVIHQAKYMTAVSDYIANHLKKYFGYKRNLQIIPNGIYSPENHNHFKVEKRQRKEMIYFSISNGWGKLKNEEKLLGAFHLVRQKIPNAELWMFGREHGLNEAAYQWAAKKKLTEGVKFIGEVSHNVLLNNLSQYADVLVHPSLEESFGNILLEALIFSVPVIGGEKSGAVPSVLANGNAGLLVNVKSSQKLAEGMLLFGENRSLRQEFGEKGRNHVIDHYSISKMIDSYMSTYEAVLNRA